MRCNWGITASAIALFFGFACAEIDTNPPLDIEGGSDRDSATTTSPDSDLVGTDSERQNPTDSASEGGVDSETGTASQTEDEDTDVDTGGGDLRPVECTPENAEQLCGDADLCSDGYCCDRPCHGACESCGLQGSAGRCAYLSAEIVCRDAAHSCDIAESCTGQDGECPADGAKPEGEVCRQSAGVCDPPERCSGDGSPCPADELEKAEFICRQAVDICDKAEQCTGNGPDCPADELFGTGQICRPKAGLCDIAAEHCTGTSSVCPSDSLLGQGIVCRDVAGMCDIAEKCDGLSPYCPADVYQNAGLLCRAGTVGCNTPEHCTGFSPQCPADVPSTVVYYETFDTPELPDGWEIIDGDGEGSEADGATWKYATASPPGSGGGGYWIADSDACVCYMRDSLLTSWYDLTGCSKAKIEFEHVYSYFLWGYIPDDGYVLLTYDEEEWLTLGHYSGNSSGLQSTTGTIGPGQEKFRLKFLYDSNYNYWWKIDNVKITGMP